MEGSEDGGSRDRVQGCHGCVLNQISQLIMEVAALLLVMQTQILPQADE